MPQAANLKPGVPSHNYNAALNTCLAAIVILGLFTVVLAPAAGVNLAHHTSRAETLPK